MTATVTIPLERWAALMEERAELLAFKLAITEQKGRWQVNLVSSYPTRSLPAAAAMPDERVCELQKAIKASYDGNNLSQAEWCRRHSVHPRDLSLLFHHFHLQAAGKRTLSPAKLTKLAARFLDQKEEITS